MNLVGVRYELSGRVHYLDPRGLDLKTGDRVLVESDAGQREADVVIAPEQVLHADAVVLSGSVLRKIEAS